MADIEKLTVFSQNGEKNTDGLNLINGFPAALKPARQWFNWILNSLTTKINEVIDVANTLKSSSSNEIDRIYPVGIIIEFAIDFDPNAHYVGTTWVRHGEGKAVVGLSTKENDPLWTKTIGTTFGEYTHKLIISELPKFSLDIDASETDSDGSSRPAFDRRTDTPANISTNEIGGDVAHNIVQPSIVDARWRRTA